MGPDLEAKKTSTMYSSVSMRGSSKSDSLNVFHITSILCMVYNAHVTRLMHGKTNNDYGVDLFFKTSV